MTPATATGPAAGEGITFPRADGARPTTSAGRAVLAAAARPVDDALAARIEGAQEWRRDYLRAVRELTAASARSPEAALAIAEHGLAALRRALVVDRGGADAPLDTALDGSGRAPLTTRETRGDAARVAELRVPVGGRELHGTALLDQLDRWVAAGVVEPSFAEAVGRVVANPQWLALTGRRVVVIGAASELGPLEPLTAWGAHVLAVDLPSERACRRIDAVAGRGAGTVALPIAPDGSCGVDVLRRLPELRDWIEANAGDDALVLGMYAYADGGAHVRVTAAFDLLAEDLLARRPGTAIAYLATPTDAFVVPDDVVAAARAAWDARRVRAVAQAPLRTLSRGRLFAPAYADGEPVADILVEQQGPNYALAKRLQRWRGVLAARDGHPVSFNVAPPAMTRSVTKNRVLAAAYAGAPRFGVEVFAPDTTRALMAALLVHDLHVPAPPGRHPETLFSDAAAHGGLWRAAYEPRSVLGLAALAGLPAALRPGR